MSYTALGFLISAIFLFACFVVASTFNYKARFKKNYHLRSHFPYELNYHGRYQDNIYGNIIYALNFVAVVVFFVFFSNGFTNGYLIFALVAGAITLISLTALVYIPIDNLRLHMIVVALAFIFSLGFSFAIVLASYFKYKELNSVPAMISLIVSAVTSAFYAILILNPKLSHWAEMEDKTNEDGTVIKVRPKWFVLAYSEWAMMILYLVSLLSLFIETI